MNRAAFVFRVLLAILGTVAASRAGGGHWEPTIYAAAIAGLTTAEAFVRDPKDGAGRTT